ECCQSCGGNKSEACEEKIFSLCSVLAALSRCTGKRPCRHRNEPKCGKRRGSYRSPARSYKANSRTGIGRCPLPLCNWHGQRAGGSLDTQWQARVDRWQRIQGQLHKLRAEK